MTIKLSVNLNKVCLLRNARGSNYPNLNEYMKTALKSGVDGITLHPRPDLRHATPKDIISASKFCYKNNIELINNNSVSIYLKASVDTLVKRLKDAKINRPLISHLKDRNELKDFISKHLFERNYFYEKAEIKIKTDDLKLGEITNLIIGSLA